MLCVISQPTFLPWIGWFDLADQADRVILLDDVQFSKRSWQQRNRIRTPKGLEFLSVPVKSSGRYDQRIADCEIAEPGFVERMTRTIRANYAKAPWFDAVMHDLDAVRADLASADPPRLADLNCALIALLARHLGVTTPMERASTLEAGGQRGEHLAALCEGAGATAYLSTVGAEAYLLEDRAAFDARGIAVWIHVYEHPVYAQRFEPFMPYASAIDLALNVGPGSGAVMRAGRRPSRPLGAPAETGERV